MSINVCIYWPGKVAPWLPPWLEAIKSGFERHGQAYTESKYADIVDCDLAVFWSMRPLKVVEKQRNTGGDFLLMEMGYVGDRREWTSLGFNGLNGWGEYEAVGMDGDRWNENFKDRLIPADNKAWMNGDYILLIGQVKGDMSIKDVDIWKWYDDTVDRLSRLYPGVSVRYRQHPIEKERNPRKVAGTEYSECSVAEDIAGAKLIITYNSNFGVDAVLSGKPTVVSNRGGTAWPVAMRTISDPVKVFARNQWAYDLAWKQWKINEIASGDAWAHLKKRYE